MNQNCRPLINKERQFCLEIQPDFPAQAFFEFWR